VGDYKEYHENGQLKTEGKFEDGERHGAWMEYDEAGKLITKSKYAKGKKAKN
jgi:YD repeat-containing protein